MKRVDNTKCALCVMVLYAAPAFSTLCAVMRNLYNNHQQVLLMMNKAVNIIHSACQSTATDLQERQR